MSVGILTPDEARQYVELRAEMLATDPHAFGADPTRDVTLREDGICKRIAKPDHAVLVARSATGLNACAGIYRDITPKAAHRARVWGVYVRRECRGQGLGRVVMEGAIQLARSWPGVDSVGLSVSSGAPAAFSLYESLGFRMWGVEPECLEVNGRRYDERHMLLRLEPSSE